VALAPDALASGLAPTAKPQHDPVARPAGVAGAGEDERHARSGGPATADADARARKRIEKSAARREAIVAAALSEFTERGYAAARLDDVAKRAGVAKGTIYLHFKDKEALFQHLVTTMLGPLVAQLEKLPDNDAPLRVVLQRLFALFTKELYGARRRDVLRLVMTEGPRFPQLAEFYYRHVVERAMASLRGLIDRARARGELRDDRLSQFPQLVVAPGLIAIIWSGLFDRFAPLDLEGLMRVHLDILLGAGDEP
jgi:AcrR family transcriptional regulator